MARRHTPYYHRFVELGAEIVDRIGFDAALSFTSVREEHLATRNAVGVYDVYYQGPIDVKGPDAEALLQRLAVRDVARRLDDGGVLYTSLCNDGGGIIDDLTIYRLAAEHFWIIATPARAETVEGWVTEQARGSRAYVTNTISGTAYLSVQGPRSRELLSRLCQADLSSEALPYFRFLRTVVADVPTILSRTGYSGELGYELYYPRDYAEHIWDSVLDAGRDLGAVPAGLGALRSVRIEKKYPLYGLDLDETASPLEGGLEWTVDFDRGDFVGRDALLGQRDAGVSRRLVGIAFSDMEFLPGAGDEVSLEGRPVGKVTSSDHGWHVGTTLALASVAPGAALEGAEVTLTSAEGGSSRAGRVTTRPFYDPEGARLRA